MPIYHYYCFTEFKPGEVHHFDGVLTTHAYVTADNYAAIKSQIALQIALQTELRPFGEQLVLSSLAELPRGPALRASHRKRV